MFTGERLGGMTVILKGNIYKVVDLQRIGNDGLEFGV
jgi:hypothetical protein